MSFTDFIGYPIISYTLCVMF